MYQTGLAIDLKYEHIIIILLLGLFGLIEKIYPNY